MKRLTHERSNGIKSGYWSTAKRDDLVQVLAAYENTGLTPDQIKEMDELYHEKCREVAKLTTEVQHAVDQWNIWSEAYQKDVRYWIPVEEQLPEDDNYILVAFKNFSTPLIGCYVRDGAGGAFYVGDDESCIGQDLIVNAWMPLPEPYRSRNLKFADQGAAAGGLMPAT